MKKKMKLMLLVVAMAVIVGASMDPVSAATLTLDETVEISFDKSACNISVYPGKASYSGSIEIEPDVYESVTGVFGDGTVLGYRFVNSNELETVISSYADDGTGIVAPVVSPIAEDIDGSDSWANVWTTTDPGVDFANAAGFIDDTLARGSGITGTIDISDLSSGTVYVICGGLKDDLTLTLTMSGAGQTDIQAEYLADAPSRNILWVVPFDFSDAVGYDTITYTYTFAPGTAETRRGRFLGVIIDSLVSTATNHDPANGETVDTADPLTLRWTNINPNDPSDDLYVDVWFGTDPGTIGETTWKHVLVSEQDATFVNVNASADGTYYWRIDVTIGDDDTLEGLPRSFTATTATNDPAPSVVINTADQITWSGEPVPLNATITNEGVSPTIITWSVDAPDGILVEFEPAGADTADTEDTTVTLTKVSYTGPEGTVYDPDMSTVTVKVAVSDGANPIPVEESIEIDVYEDACEMAKQGLDTPVADSDFNADCITDLLDFAEMASSWLVDYAATEADD